MFRAQLNQFPAAHGIPGNGIIVFTPDHRSENIVVRIVQRDSPLETIGFEDSVVTGAAPQHRDTLAAQAVHAVQRRCAEGDEGIVVHGNGQLKGRHVFRHTLQAGEQIGPAAENGVAGVIPGHQPHVRIHAHFVGQSVDQLHIKARRFPVAVKKGIGLVVVIHGDHQRFFIDIAGREGHPRHVAEAWRRGKEKRQTCGQKHDKTRGPAVFSQDRVEFFQGSGLCRYGAVIPEPVSRRARRRRGYEEEQPPLRRKYCLIYIS